MLVYARMEVESEYFPIGVLFESEEDFADAMKCKEVFSANNILRFCVRGEDYEERKDNLRDLAVAWSNADCPDCSMMDLAKIGEFFEKNGKRYGLLAEFRENGII